MSTNLATEQAMELMRSTQLMLQQSNQQMSNQQTQCTDQDKVMSNLEKPELAPKKGEPGPSQGTTSGEPGPSQGTTSGEYDLCVAMASMMSTNLSVMGAQAGYMEAMQSQIVALNEQLTVLGNKADHCTGLSGIETLERTTSINEKMSVVNAQLNNMTTSASQDGSYVSSMAAENNLNAGVAQSMLQYSFVRQVAV